MNMKKNLIALLLALSLALSLCACAASAPAAVLTALADAARYAFLWLKNPGPWLIAALIPVLSLGRGGDGTVPRAVHPALLLAGSFLLFAAGFAPSEYALSMPGEARLIDIQYDLYLVLILVNLANQEAYASARAKRFRRLLSRPVVAVCAAALCAAAALTQRTGAGISALRILSDGTAETYRAEWAERIDVLEHSEEDGIVFERLTRRPPLICQMDLAPDPGDPYYFFNEQVARYYGKSSVLRTPDPPS